MKKLEELVEETHGWNNGKGINIEAWISLEGNFNFALGYSTIFWPEFEEYKGYILRKGFSAESVEDWERHIGEDKRHIEKVMNHFHLSDLHNHNDDKCSIEKIVRLGQILKEIYEAKLKWKFPNKCCLVEFFEPEEKDNIEGYQLTFWQPRHDNT